MSLFGGESGYTGGAGGETRLWTPADTTTVNWFDADDASTITDGGGLVSTWADKSGGAHDLTATAQPQTGITSINGLNTLYFDGSDFMSNASFPIPTSTSKRSWAWV